MCPTTRPGMFDATITYFIKYDKVTQKHEASRWRSKAATQKRY